MRRPPMDWLRYHTDTLDNPKIQRLPAEVFKSWVNFLCIARICHGSIPDASDLAFRLRCSESEATRQRDELVQYKLLDQDASGYATHDWNEYQYQSDSS